MWHSFLTCFSFMVSDFDISYFYSVSALAEPPVPSDCSSIFLEYAALASRSFPWLMLVLYCSCRARARSSAASY